MSLTRTKKRESQKPQKPEVHQLKGAYIIPAEAGDKMINALAELPIKYSQSVGPMIDSMQKAFRGDITVTVDPNKLRPPMGKAPGEIPPVVKPKAEMEVKKPTK